VHCQVADGFDHRLSCKAPCKVVDRKRYLLLERIFQEKGLAWSAEVFPLYQEWDHGKTGNRWEKMVAFAESF
jgi:hypothetical protein